MNGRSSVFFRRRRRAAFSLVEVALAVGVVGFALTAILGAIPLASDLARQSIVQGRASCIANTVFANFRAQPFNAVQYLDAPVGVTATGDVPIDLNVKTINSADNVSFYAVFDESPTTAPADDARRLHFVAGKPARQPYFKVVLGFNNNPAGTLAPYIRKPNGAPHAQANGIEASITVSDRPRDVYRFSSVVVNRTE